MRSFKWDKKYFYWGVTAFCVIVCSLLFYTAVSRWSQFKAAIGFGFRVLMPIFAGLCIAYLLTPAVRLLEQLFQGLGRRVFPKSPKKAKGAVRAMCIALVLLIAFLAVAGLLVMLLPQVYASIERLLSNMEGYITAAIGFAQQVLDRIPWLETATVNLLQEAQKYFTDFLNNTLLPNINVVITSVYSGLYGFLRAVLNLLVGVVISIYVMYNREQFAANGRKVLYSILSARHVETVLGGLGIVNEAFGGFFRGKILDSTIIGLITFVGLTIMDMPYSSLISVIVGITNMIPFFGPFIGAVPSAFLILMESPLKCLLFVIFIIVLQQIDGNIIGPRILSNTTGLSGFWVMFAILVGGGMFGFAGMLFGVPVMSVIHAAVSYLVNRKLERKNLPTSTLEYIKDPPAANPPSHQEDKE